MAMLYYKGGKWWLPPSSNRGESCEFVFARDSSMHQMCSNYALTNLLFGLCRFVWIIDLLVICFNLHPGALTHSSTPLNATKLGSIPQLLIIMLFHFGFTIESIKKLGGALQVMNLSGDLLILLKHVAKKSFKKLFIWKNQNVQKRPICGWIICHYWPI